MVRSTHGRAPAVVIAAPASGSGKTTIATGLIGALRRRGHTVAPFKVGPDYIDPSYHGLAAGRPGRNLDPVLVGAERVAPLYNYGSRGCDLAVVEGVMGLFDGRIEDAPQATDAVAEGSTAHVAGLLGAPVVLVVDARGHSQSLAAVLHGFATFDSAVRLGGVILNRVGSERHEQVLRAACALVGLPVLGAVPRMDELSVPARHLGLVPAAEHGLAATAAVSAMAELVAAHVDLAAITALADSDAGTQSWDPAQASGAVSPRVTAPSNIPVVALVGGPAFTFGYAEHRELLTAAGAEIVVIDPLRDETLPDDVSALVVPGGFPEEHAAELSANVVLREQIAEQARRGMPVHAECAGLLYLARSLDGLPMAGVLDAAAEFGPTLTLGYRDAVALVDSPLWRAGSRVRGHEFHRTRLTAAPSNAEPAWAWRDSTGVPVREGCAVRGIHASYLHTHPVGNPTAVTGFVTAAAAYTVVRRAAAAHGVEVDGGRRV